MYFNLGGVSISVWLKIDPASDGVVISTQKSGGWTGFRVYTGSGNIK